MARLATPPASGYIPCVQRASCPACGAPILFANKGSLATVCDHCRSVVQRKGTKLEDYGKIGAIRDDATPLMVGTEGTWNGRRFQLIGRLQLYYLDATWNEWHMAFEDGSFAWLAEAQGFYSVHEPELRTPAPSRPFDSFQPGTVVRIGKELYRTSGVARARCLGGEGSLPFPVAGGYDLPYVDLTSEDDRCGTIDYSDDGPPKLFLGRYCGFEDLALTNLREELPPDHPMAQVGTATVEKIACPSCGGGLERRTGLMAKAMYCHYCGGGIDVRTEPYKIFARQQWSGLNEARVPLGGKVDFEGVEFIVLAHLVREAVRWGVRWTETLLHHPHRGYRWLIEADGHFSWVEPLHEWPAIEGSTASVRDAKNLKYLEENTVAVRKVAGELYWRVRAGDVCQATDYVGPPYMLSREETDDEVTWSLSRYMSPAEVARALRLPDPPPEPSTVAPHQPSPVDKYFTGMVWRYVVAVAILIGGTIAYHATSERALVKDADYVMELPGPALERALAAGGENPEIEAYLDKNTVWVGPLEIPDGPTTLDIDIRTQVDNSWLFFRFALYDEERGEAVDFAEEVSYYHGPDWSEGSNSSSVTVPGLAAGNYWLRVEPIGGDWKGRTSTNYKLLIRRGVPLMQWPGIAFLILTIPMIIVGIRKSFFEKRRRESM